jgi:hypothetical protein
VTFNVVPESVASFGDKVHDLKVDADAAKVYAARTRPPASGIGAMVRLLNSCQEERPAVEGFFGHLSSISDASAKELHAAAKKYASLDAAAAASLDAKYPKG